ncbi:MAG TPA: DMT family transporter [Sedimentisphaerales bacterium]|nr:DMT family transporter [Sedimentisphaerales bacterium]
MYSGIFIGLLAAFFHSVSYLSTKVFNKVHGNDIVTLFVLSHIIMGVISIPLAILLLPEKMPELSSYIWLLLGSSIFYLLGQLFLFSALEKSEPSSVSMFLGLKVFMLAIIGFVFLHQSLNIYQWIAVILSSCSIMMLSGSGKKQNFAGFICVMLACVSYCFSDLSIKALIDHFRYIGVFKGSVFSASICYILCGFLGTSLLLFKPHHINKQAWLLSLPFAFSWFAAMICLFSCFAMVGVIFGSILQSTRGIISIVLGYLIANCGYEILEAKITKKVFMIRILAGILMTGAIALFYYCK